MSKLQDQTTTIRAPDNIRVCCSGSMCALEAPGGRPTRPTLTLFQDLIDGNKKNNDPDNLVLITRRKHSAEHSRKYNPVCIVPGCGEKHFSKGYCQRHIWQIRRHGKIINIKKDE